MFNEVVTIWSSKNLSKRDDYDIIKEQLSRNGKTANIASCVLLNDLEDVKVYRVSYDYEDSRRISKPKVKK